jgi:hypothetical protein
MKFIINRMDIISRILFDVVIRSFSLIVTILIISIDNNSRVKEFLLCISIFNIAVVFFNFGGQFYKGFSLNYKKKWDHVHLYIISIITCLYYFDIFNEIIFSSILLGLMYSRINEFELRRNKKFKTLSVITLIIVMPRIVGFYLEINYSVSVYFSVLLLLFLIFNQKISPVDENDAKSIINYAFGASVLYAMYQNIPAMISADLGVSESERFEQILAKLIFAFMFLKSSFVVSFIGKNLKYYSFVRKIGWYVLVLDMVMLILFEYKIIGRVFLYAVLVGSFIFSELYFGMLSSLRHSVFDYKEFFYDNLILLSVGIIFVLSGGGLFASFVVSSIILLIVRYKENDFKAYNYKVKKI